jgi:hypothetical protein
LKNQNKKLYFAVFTVTIIVAILGGAIWANIIPLNLNNLSLLGTQTTVSYAENQVALMKQRDWLSGGIGTYTHILKLGGSDFGWRTNRMFLKYDMLGPKSILSKMSATSPSKIHIISANIVLTQIGSEGTDTDKMTIGVYRMYPDYIACNKDNVWVDESMYQSSISFQTLVVDDPLGYIDPITGKNKVYSIDVTDELQNIFSSKPEADVYGMPENIFFQWILKCDSPPESTSNDLKLCMIFACTDYLAHPNGPWSPTDPKLEIEWEYYPTCDVYAHINPSRFANIPVDKDLPPYVQWKPHTSNWMNNEGILFDSNKHTFTVGDNIDFRAVPQTFTYNGVTYTMNHMMFGGTEYTQTFSYIVPSGVSRIDLTIYYFDDTIPTYKVTVSLAGKGGSVDHLGINNIQQGGSLTLNPIEVTGYKFDYITRNSIKIDGKTITNIQSDLTILVYFAEDNIITKLLGEYLLYEIAGGVVIICLYAVLRRKTITISKGSA